MVPIFARSVFLSASPPDFGYDMPMNLKDEIVAGESYSLEFKRVPNEEREKYLKTVVAFANGKE